MQNPWGVPEIVNIAGFPLPKMGGLNPEEKDYMADKIRNVQFQEIAPLAEIADIVIEKEKISKIEAISLIRKTLEGNGGKSEEEVDKLLAFAIEYQHELSRIKKPDMLIEKQSQEVAVMILRSRLAPQWVLENIDNLKASFRCSLEKEQCALLMTIPEENWLTDVTREKVIRQIVRKLPENIYGHIAAFALGEEREWAELPMITVEPGQEVTLGERSKGFGNTKKPPKKSANSTVNATLPSNTSESQTPVSTGDTSTASPVG
ncbi:hypothetical protein G7B40_040140 [Aetokthonos hydrillicola Thurmond2011]|jgi:hypothetical protein|uniref:Uncharacterized protein n=1 Tax=Aetokthonos hydrillicola Thurmond2011 TaxID=2712845 RepID=A0AAP5IFM8_9CYAN|nr:hypothetical protein [Aetokthonos hydrillicola]MBO3459939.1 hypothetical protein [Aetokthonos hydrillicola CCALA 1050]MBW4584058.1 hypothetical protein [Aetokthonos hydrillicola CCALA 1050]MDR9900700.1 hypothetical protein [Aetokthonos hydrillicola Thurmond2011]